MMFWSVGVPTDLPSAMTIGTLYSSGKALHILSPSKRQPGVWLLLETSSCPMKPGGSACSVTKQLKYP
jgi:hypothetical protein